MRQRRDEDKDPTTRREFRASLGTRSNRKSDTKVKRAGSGKNTTPTKKTYAQLVKVWAAAQTGAI